MSTAGKFIEKLRAAGHFLAADVYTDEKGAAYLLGSAPRTLRAWRAVGVGPPAMFSSRWLYDVEKLAAWADAGGNRRIDSYRTGSDRQIPVAGGKR